MLHGQLLVDAVLTVAVLQSAQWQMAARQAKGMFDGLVSLSNGARNLACFDPVAVSYLHRFVTSREFMEAKRLLGKIDLAQYAGIPCLKFIVSADPASSDDPATGKKLFEVCIAGNGSILAAAVA